MNHNIERFFGGCKNPINVSEVITDLAAGTQLKVALLPVELLPALLLLATIGVREYNQQIVDDFEYLYQRMDETFEMMRGRAAHDHGGEHEYDLDAVQLSNAQVWHPELFLVSMLCIAGPRAPFTLNLVPEAGYMFKVYEELVNADISRLFAQVVEAEGRKAKPQGKAAHNGTQSRKAAAR